MSRQKDILYSSRTRYSTDVTAKIQNTREVMREVLAGLPVAARATPGIKRLQALLKSSPVDIVHLIYRHKPHELESKDDEFSRASVLEHWRIGRRDMRQALDHPAWLQHSGLDDGVSQYNLHPRDEP